MEDGNLIICEILGNLRLIKLIDKGIEIIQSFKMPSFGENIYILSEEKIIALNEPNIYIYSYIKGKIIEEHKCYTIKDLENYGGENYIIISESGIAVYDEGYNIFNIYYSYLNFYDIIQKKKIKSINLGNSEHDMHPLFNLIEKNILLVGCSKKILLIDINNHKIKNKFSLKKNEELFSIIPLNKKMFLALSENSFLSQYEIKNEKIIILQKKKLMVIIY